MPAKRRPKHIFQTHGARGRRFNAAKRDRVLTLATQVILERGYQLTSMDLIARQAGVSKATLYFYFDSKEALFRAVVSHLAGDLLAAINSFTVKDLPLERALRRVGQLYLNLVLSSAAINLYRIIIAEAARHPALGQLVYRNGPLRAVEALTDYLGQQQALQIGNSRLAAESFFGLLLGHAQLRLLLEVPSTDRKQVSHRQIVHDAVQTFLCGTLKQSPEAGLANLPSLIGRTIPKNGSDT